MQIKLLTIIILGYNSERWIEKQFDSILSYRNIYFEIIFFDNNSTDNSNKILAKYKNNKHVKIIFSKKNLGYAMGNNEAFKLSNSKYVLFLNNDTYFDEHSLRNLFIFLKNKKQEIFGLNIKNYDGSMIDEKQTMSVDIFGYPVPSDKLFYIDGSSIGFDSKIFEKLGMFDEDHFIFAEDIDICWRAIISGYSLSVCNNSNIYHYMGGSAEGSKTRNGVAHKTSEFRRFHTEKNTLTNILKNYSLFLLPIIIPLYLILIFAEISFFLLIKKNFSFVKNVYIKMLFYNLRNISKTLKKRKKIQKNRRINDFKLLISKIEIFKFYKIKIFFKYKEIKIL